MPLLDGRHRPARFLGLPWLVLLLSSFGCVEVTEPAAPAIVIPEGSTECSSFCECDADEVRGAVFRVTRLEIDEPDAFAQILNLMWETDIQNNILNVLFVVDDVVQGTAAAFNRISISGGPGWRDPKMPYILEPAAGEPSSSMVESYCLLEGLSVPMELRPYHGYQCQFKSAAPSSLYFHSGPKDAPLICAPANEPPNNIPISDLKIRASYNRDCTAIQEGFLEGCITVDAADRICMCLGAGACPWTPVPDAEFTADDLTGYCKSACGPQWISFGGLVKTFQLLPSCLTPEGVPGYRVQGFFDADRLDPVQYNPISSDDCAASASGTGG